MNTDFSDLRHAAIAALARTLKRGFNRQDAKDAKDLGNKDGRLRMEDGTKCAQRLGVRWL